MSHLKFPVTEHVKAELRKHGVRRVRSVKVRKESYDKFLESIQAGGYSHLSDEQKHALAIGCCMTHPDHKGKHRRIPQFWYWIAAAIGLLLLLGVSARAQGTSQIDVITFQDNSAVPIKTFAAPFRIQCGFNMTCTASGSVLTIAGPAASGTVTSFSAGTLPPLFTTSVANPTTTPALSFSLSNAADKTFFGNHSGSAAVPSFIQPAFTDISGTTTAAQEPATTVNSVTNDTNVTGAIAAQALILGWTGTLAKARNLATAVYTDQNNTYSAGTTQAVDTITAKYWGSAPVFDATKYAGADMCAKILAVYSDAAYLAAANAIVDATGFSGSQNCASNMLAITRPTWLKLGAVTLHVTVNQAAGFPTTAVLAAPATPTSASTTTTGGTLNNLVLVKTGYATAWMPPTENNRGISAEATVAMNAACTGTPTCTATINSPAAAVGAYGYNVFQSTTTGTEKQCNVAPIPLGENYKIAANCAGSAISIFNGAFLENSILSGIGDMTKISLENAAASIDGSGTWNWIFKDMSIVSNLTTQSVNGMLQLGNNNESAENITFSGGGNHIYITGSMVTVKNTRHFGFTQTTGPVAAITAFNTKWLRVEDTVMSNFTFPVSATLNNGISLNQCTICTVDGVLSENVDNSQAANGGSMLVATGDGTAANASSHITFLNFLCENLVNVNCGDFLNFTHDSSMGHGRCRNTNNTAGVGSNILGADCYDMFMAAHINLTDLIGNHRGGPGGLCCPTLEAYSVSDMTVNGSNFSDDQGNEGVRIVGSPAISFNGVIASRNLNSGIVLADLSAVVTCNNTTTLAWVSGQPFGPWQVGTQVWIGAVPTAFNIASVTDFHTMVLTTTCNLGASQAFAVYTQDASLTAPKLDDNGQAGTGTGVRTGLAEGLYVSGHSQVGVNGGSANDNAPIAANKHQQYAVRMENNARGRFVGMDMTGNGGGSNCLLEGNNVAGNHTYCDSGKTSAFFMDDNSGEIWINSGTKRITANVSNSTTTVAPLTGMFWTLAANRSYYLACDLIYQAAATGGLKMAFTGPASPTQAEYCLNVSTSATANAAACTAAANVSLATVVGATAVATATTNWPAKFFGTIENGANSGVLQIQFASVAAVSTTVERGSACTLTGVN